MLIYAVKYLRGNTHRRQVHFGLVLISQGAYTLAVIQAQRPFAVLCKAGGG
ncbi:hypothetical protein D3C80_2000410 [compost metagenome]